MKRLLVLSIILVLCGSLVFSQENFDYAWFTGISIGGGGLVTPDVSGGFLDFGFNLYSKMNDDGQFSIRNYIELNAGGFKDHGIYGVRERLVFGGTTAISDNFAIKGYGGVDFGAFAFQGVSKANPFEGAFLIDTRGFGGVELLFLSDDSTNGSFFIESGGGPRFTTDGSDLPSSIATGFGFVSAGGRIYF